MSRSKALLRKLNLNSGASDGAKDALLNYAYRYGKELEKEQASRPKAPSSPEQLAFDLEECGSYPTFKKSS